MEEWKEIPGYEGLYEASTEGRIRALPKQTRLHYRPTQLKLRIKKHFLTRNGYPRISLTKDGQRTHYSVHRLVALSFLDKEEGKDFVNHKNGVRHDNRLSNLEWVTPSENVTPWSCTKRSLFKGGSCFGRRSIYSGSLGEGIEH